VTLSFDSKISDRLIECLRTGHSVSAVYLFGSQNQGYSHPESDIDLAVLFREPPDPLVLLDIQDDLSGIAGRRVDLVSLNDASPVLCRQVIKYGSPLLIEDHIALAEFVIIALSKYFDLKMVRRPIEDNLLREMKDG